MPPRLLDPDVLDDDRYFEDKEPDLTPRRVDGRRQSPSALWWFEADRLTTLKKGYTKGTPLRLIAKQLGCSCSKAAGKAHRMGWRHPNSHI